MTAYAYVEDQEIKEIHYFLPKNWRNISNLDVLSQDELKKISWFPIVDGPINYDQETQEIEDFTLQISEDCIERIYTYRNKLIVEQSSITVSETTQESNINQETNITSGSTSISESTATNQESIIN